MVQTTGPSSAQTRNMIGEMKKAGKKTEAGIFLEVARILAAPTRKRVSINLWRLGKLNEQFKGKVLVVPGKVLGTGDLEGKIEVAALAFSEEAKKKISKNGKALTLSEITVMKPGQLMLVK